MIQLWLHCSEENTDDDQFVFELHLGMKKHILSTGIKPKPYSIHVGAGVGLGCIYAYSTRTLGIHKTVHFIFVFFPSNI